MPKFLYDTVYSVGGTKLPYQNPARFIQAFLIELRLVTDTDGHGHS